MTLAVKSEWCQFGRLVKRVIKSCHNSNNKKVQITHDIRVTRLGEASGVRFLRTQLDTITYYFGQVVAYLVEFQVLQSE